jgi:hypothetical protein
VSTCQQRRLDAARRVFGGSFGRPPVSLDRCLIFVPTRQKYRARRCAPQTGSDVLLS